MRKSLKIIVLVGIVTLLLSVLALTFMKNHLVVYDELTTADAVVVLMGANPTRIPVAADIYMNGYAETIIIAQGATAEAQEGKRDALALGIPKDHIVVIPGQARSTWDEALIVRGYLAEQKDINSLIIVTSRLQTRRAVTTFHRVLDCLDRDIIFISRAAGHEFSQEEFWWYDLRNVRSIAIENLKNVYYYFLWLNYKGCDQLD